MEALRDRLEHRRRGAELHPLLRRRRRRLAAAGAALVVLVAYANLGAEDGDGPQVPEAQVTRIAEFDAPQDYMAPHWLAHLDPHDHGDHGDHGDTGEAPHAATAEIDFAALADPAASDLGVEAAQAASELAGRVLTAYLTGQGRDEWPGHFEDPFAADNPDADVAGSCGSVTIRAAAAAALPGIDSKPSPNAKVLLVWTGSCPAMELAAHAVGEENPADRVSFVYLAPDGGGWKPVRVTELPGSGGGYILESRGGLAAWQLSELTCGAAGARALPEVAAAWDAMCAAAATDGIELRAVSSYRDPAEQAAMFADAVEIYGSVQEARRRVAPADGVDCSSRHCAGTAIDVAETTGALDWLTGHAGCFDGSTLVPARPCPQGTTAVTRLQLYGFAQTLPHQRSHLDYVLDVELPGSDGRADCSPPRSHRIPSVIAQVWRCQLGAAGLSAETIRIRVAEAVAVARCSSGWNADAIEHGGQFLDSPHPQSGRTHDGRGVFLITKAQAASAGADWEALSDPVANAETAARVGLDRSGGGADSAAGWRPWACAAELVGDGDGQSLPDWAWGH